MTDSASPAAGAIEARTLADEVRLLESIILRRRGKAESARVSRALIDRFGRIGNVLRAGRRELASVSGSGPDIGAEIRATGRLLLALARHDISHRPLLAAQDAVARYCRSLMAGERREQLHVLYLDKAMRLIDGERLQVGTVDHVCVYPREIIGSALNRSATGIILAHNHPSGSPQPSAADIAMTEQIRRAGTIFGLRLVDHVIVGAAQEYSFVAHGLLAPIARP